MDGILLVILCGILGGILRVLLGVFQANEAFDIKKAGRSIGIAIILGIIAGVALPGMDWTLALTGTFFGTITIEAIGIGIKKRM